MFDYHMHTSFSADSQEPIEAYLAVMKDRGIQNFCVTEHMAVNFHRGNWMVDLDSYVPKIRRLQEQGWPVQLGVEVDVNCAEADVPELVQQLSRYPLDFVLASSHSYHNLDPFIEAFFLEEDPIHRCRAYLQENAVIVAMGRVSYKEEEGTRLLVEQVMPVAEYDPTRGFGIFVENMLKTADEVADAAGSAA